MLLLIQFFGNFKTKFTKKLTVHADHAKKKIMKLFVFFKFKGSSKGELTIEYFQNPSDLAVYKKKFISRGFKIKKNLSSQSDNFSKKKKTR
jgi:hypothetical protein